MRTGFHPEARRAAGFLRGGGIVVGIAGGGPETARAAHAVSNGLVRYYPGFDSVVVVCGGDRDAPQGVGKILYLTARGPNAHYRPVIDLAAMLSAKAVAILDPRSASPEAVDGLIRPVLTGGQDFVAPVYRDGAADGLIHRLTLYPMMRCLYGWSMRNPGAAEFGLSPAMASALAGSSGWESEAAGYSPALWAASVALSKNFRVCDSAVGVHRPAMRGVVDRMAALFSLMGTREGLTSGTHDDPEMFGAEEDAPAHGGEDTACVLGSRFAEARQHLDSVWRTFLRRETVDRLMSSADGGPAPVSDGLWAHILFESAEAFQGRTWFGPPVLDSFPVLLAGRSASYLRGVCTGIDRSCQVFEAVRTQFEDQRMKGARMPCWI